VQAHLLGTIATHCFFQIGRPFDLRGRNYNGSRGRPDFVPVWELNEVDGIWYHIDDIEHLTAATDPPANPNFNPYIPYSYSPPAEGETFSYASLIGKREVIQKSLGQLYSVPPDSRVLLTFERNQLRLAQAGGNLDSYLGRVDAFSQKLYESQGSFQIVDFDDFMVSTRYDAKFIELGETWDPEASL
jgi:hypothetical protein